MSRTATRCLVLSLALVGCATPAAPEPQAPATRRLADAPLTPRGVLQDLARAQLDPAQPASRLHLEAGDLVVAGADLTARLQSARDLLAARLGLLPQQVAALETSRTLPLRSGAGVGVWRAHVDGLPVLGSELRVLVGADGRVLAWSAEPGLRAGLPQGLRPVGPTIDAREAIARAGEAVFGARPEGLSLPTRVTDDWLAVTQEPGARTGSRLVQPGRARAVVVRRASGWHRAFEVEVWGAPKAGDDDLLWYVVVDAEAGDVVSTALRTHDESFSYRVWAEPTGDRRPADGPLVESTPLANPTPSARIPPAEASSLVTMEAFNTNPLGGVDPWLPTGATETVGNNADAYVDVGDVDGFSAGDFRASVTSPGTFDHVYDTSLSPLVDAEQSQAAVVQAFYTVNWLHDWFYDSGFDEAMGVAQDDNFGRGGFDGDAMRVEVQDSATLGQRNNANMSTPSDGFQPRMQTYLFTGAGTAPLLVDFGLEAATGSASFGPADFDVTAELANAGSDPLGCSGVDGAVAGRIALITRGSCSFVTKVANAEAQGAVGVVIVNNTPGQGPPGMADSNPPSNVSLPTVSITFEDGADIRVEMTGRTVTATMQRADVELDSALDNQVVAHEWGHYELGRLASCGSQQCGALGEGWSDFTALHMSLREGDDRDGAYPMGVYATSGFFQAAFRGIRRAPYSRDPALNALSFRHIAQGEPLPATHAGNGNSNASVHNAGELWASAMFDAYLALQEAAEGTSRTFSDVQRTMTDLMVGAPVLVPSDFTYLEMRDALLAVASALDPADAETIALAFAGRGMGTCAEGPSWDSLDLVGVVEANGLGVRLQVEVDGLDDSALSCDGDGLLDGGEAGLLRLTVRNTGSAPSVGATLEIDGVGGLPGLVVDGGAAQALPVIAPFSSVTVTLPVHMDRLAAALAEGPLTATVVDAQACEASALDTAWVHTEADVASGVGTTDDFDTDDGSWTVDGTDAALLWGRTVDGTGLATWLGADAGVVTDARLVSPPMQVAPGVSPTLTVVHRYRLEGAPVAWWDGGVLELSVDGGAFEDITTWADPGYDGVLEDISGNPLGGRPAFSGASGAWPAFETLTLPLGPSLAGRTVQLRFRIGTDVAVGDFGWEIDRVGLTGLVSPPFPAFTADDSVCNQAPVAVGQAVATARSGDVVSLDGSASFDPQGEPLTFTWSEVTSLTTDLTPSGAFGATFTAPLVASPTTLSFELVVSDGTASALDQVDVLVSPPPLCVGDEASGDADGDGLCDDLDTSCDLADVDLGGALGPAVVTGNTCGAGEDVQPADFLTCGPASGAGAGEDVVYSWTAPFTGRFAFSTAGSAFDTTLTVYEGSTSATCGELACNDDYPGAGQSSLVLDAVAGQTVSIAVDGTGAACGAFGLTIVPVTGAVLTLDTPLTAGATVTWTVLGAVPGAPLRLYFSRPGAVAGNRTPFPGGPSTSLDFPKGVTQVVVPPEGTFEVSAVAPGNLPAGLPFSFEGVYFDGVEGGVTNVVTVLSE